MWKKSIPLLTMTSVAVYPFHLLAQFCVSSFHLARDAEKRAQLTYVYLALLEQNSFETEEKESRQ